MSNFTLDEGIL